MIYLVSKQTTLDYEDNTCIKTVTIEEAVRYCKVKNVLGVDTETEGLFNHKNKIVMFQIGDSENQFIIDARTEDITVFKDILEDSSIVKILANAKFDYKFLKLYGINMNNIYDTQLGEMVLTTGIKGSKVGLNSVAKKYLDITLDKEERNKFIGIGSAPFTLKQIIYGADDVKYLTKIRLKQLRELESKDLTRTINLENLFVEVLSDIEYNGFYLDRHRWKTLAVNNKEEVEKARRKLINYVVKNSHHKFIDYQIDMFNTEAKVHINWDSPKQVIEFLKYLEIPTTIVEEGKVKDTCSETHLSKFKKKYDFIPIYLHYKQAVKKISTYGEEFLNNINPTTGRVHSDYWQIVSTGRISSKDPNLQNIPGDEYKDEQGNIRQPFRECFRAEEGNTLIVADYSQQEPRVTADKSGDRSLIDFYTNGDGDTHSMVASKMFSVIENKPVKIVKGDPRRQIGKVLNLKLDYGGSAFTVKDDLETDEETAQGFIDALERAFPEKQAYFKRVIKQTIKNGYILIDPITKRKSFLKNFDRFLSLQKKVDVANRHGHPLGSFPWSEYYSLKGEIERKSKNFPIQGTSGSMTKLAAIYLKRELINKKVYDRVKIVNLVHDEIVCECPKEISKLVAKVLTESMEKAGKVFCTKVKMIADAVISDYWTH